MKGNCESEVDQMVLEFPIMADYCILYLNDRMIFATHGHVHNLEHVPMLKRETFFFMDIHMCRFAEKRTDVFI